MAAVINVDQQRVEEVCGLLVRASVAGEFPYNVAKEPQHRTPAEIRAKRKVYALLMFGACFYMRGTIQSDFAFKQMLKIYHVHPELFDPKFLSQPHITEEYVFVRLKAFIKYRLFEIPRLWLMGFRRLEEDWGGDVFNLFAGVTTSAELYRRIVNIESLPAKKRTPDKLRGFVGAREKIANMLAYFLLEAGMIPPIETSSPFDFHNGRAFIATGAITLEGEGPFRFEDVTGVGSAAVEAYCRTHNVPMEVVAKSLWLISTGACRRAPGNKTLGRDRKKNKRRGKRHKLSYKPQKRQKGTLESLQMYTPDWSKQGDVRRYELSCDRCPLGRAGLCKTNVASGFFYEGGYFMTQPRTEPLPHLFAEEGLVHHATPPQAVEPEVKKKRQYVPTIPGLLPQKRITIR